MTKPERLVAIQKELEMDELEEEMEGKSEDEMMKIIEREGATREETAAVRAKHESKLRELLGKTPTPTASGLMVDIRTARKRIVRWATATGFGSITLAASVTGIYMRAANLEIVHAITGVATAAGPPMREAAWQRYEGMSFCAIHDYPQCLEWLDRARAADPGGEAAWPRVQIARTLAERALRPDAGAR